jgi:hypothetical protein
MWKCYGVSIPLRGQWELGVGSATHPKQEENNTKQNPKCKAGSRRDKLLRKTTKNAESRDSLHPHPWKGRMVWVLGGVSPPLPRLDRSLH